jgi:hypothetical protein
MLPCVAAPRHRHPPVVAARWRAPPPLLPSPPQRPPWAAHGLRRAHRHWQGRRRRGQEVVGRQRAQRAKGAERAAISAAAAPPRAAGWRQTAPRFRSAARRPWSAPTTPPDKAAPRVHNGGVRRARGERPRGGLHTPAQPGDRRGRARRTRRKIARAISRVRTWQTAPNTPRTTRNQRVLSPGCARRPASPRAAPGALQSRLFTRTRHAHQCVHVSAPGEENGGDKHGGGSSGWLTRRTPPLRGSGHRAGGPWEERERRGKKVN